MRKYTASLLLVFISCQPSNQAESWFDSMKSAKNSFSLFASNEAFPELVQGQAHYDQLLRSRAKQITKELPLDYKIGQLIHIGIYGQSVNSSIQKIVQKYHPGGVILFEANIGKAAIVTKLNQDLQQLSLKESKLPLLISVDQESGRVRRVTSQVTPFPGMMTLGQTEDQKLAYMNGFTIAQELKQQGFNFLFSPVLDVNNNPENPVINTRSLGAVPSIVAELGTAFMTGAIDAGSLPTIKHFPGHGNTAIDSHLALPINHDTVEELEKVELIPFRAAIEANAPAVMVAHILFEKIDNQNPSTLSPSIVSDLLRNKLKFQGLVITDAMEMKAVSDRYPMGEAALKAISAGVDIVLLTAQSDNIRIIFERLKKAIQEKELTEDQLNLAVERQIYQKLKVGTGNSAWYGQEWLPNTDQADIKWLDDYNTLLKKKQDLISKKLLSLYGEHKEQPIFEKGIRSLRYNFEGIKDIQNTFVFYRNSELRKQALASGVPPEKVQPLYNLRQLWIRFDQEQYAGDWIVELTEADAVAWNSLNRRDDNSNRVIVGLLAGSPFLPFQTTEHNVVLCSFTPQFESWPALMKATLRKVPKANLILIQY